MLDIEKLANAGNQEVAGLLASEAVDRDGEVFDYDASKKYFEKWSQDLYNATLKTAGADEASYGNVRLMHTKTVAGKLIKVVFNDEKKEIWGVAKVTDPKVWADIKSGVYSAFSVAGNLISSVWKAGKKWITMKPMEVSIVDYPANPDTTFDWAKGACFAKFASASSFVPDAELPDNQEFPNPSVDSANSQEYTDSSVTLRDAWTPKEKKAMNDKEKAANIEKAVKSIHSHLQAMKDAAAKHLEAAQAHHDAIHESADKAMKLAGSPEAFHGEEHSGGQSATEKAAKKAEKKASFLADVKKTIEGVVAPLAEKVAAIEKSASDKAVTEKAAKDAAEAIEKAAKAKIVGDRNDLVNTGTEVEKASQVEKAAKENKDLAVRAFGKPGTPGDPKAMDELYARTAVRGNVPSIKVEGSGSTM